MGLAHTFQSSYSSGSGSGSASASASANETLTSPPPQRLGESQVSATESIPPPPFSTPPKLLPVEYVMNNNPGSDLASLRLLTTTLARDAIFGREERANKSLSGRKNTGVLAQEKLDYMKTLVKS